MLSVHYAQLVLFFEIMDHMWKHCVQSVPAIRFLSRRSAAADRMIEFLPAVMQVTEDQSRMGGFLATFYSKNNADVGNVLIKCEFTEQVAGLLLAVEVAYSTWGQIRNKSKYEELKRMNKFMLEARKCFGDTFDGIHDSLKLSTVLCDFKK